MTNYAFYQEFLRLANRSQVAHVSSYFWRWLQDSYSESALLEIRTICEPPDKKNKRYEQTVSLYLLLSDIRKHRKILSFDWHVTQYPSQFHSDHDWPDGARRDFDAWFGKNAKHIPLRLIDKDLRSLEKAVVPIKNYVDQFVAHHDRAPCPDTPRTIKRSIFEKAIKTIEETTQRYVLYLTGKSYRSLIADVGPWKKLFAEAWIN